jgi:acetyl-CoA acetyltransferase
MNGKVAITGVGYSQIGRDTGQTEGQLAVEACRAAIADAGLDRSDIDGLTMFPFRSNPPSPFQGPPLAYVQRSLALPDLKLMQSVGSNQGQFGAVLAATYAVLAGQCTHVLTYRAHRRQSRRYLAHSPSTSDGLAWDDDAYAAPFGATGGAARLAPWAARHMHEYGTTQEQLGSVVLMCRKHALTNPRAIWKEPITLDDYMESRWISTPFKLFDCDYPIDGAVAIIISSSAAGRSSTRKPVFIEGTGFKAGPDSSHVMWPDLTYMGSRYSAEDLWSGTSLRARDVDVAELYDGFSWLAISWLEDLGFVEKGAGGPFFEAGGGRLGGSKPVVCTDGGQLGAGRLHGFGKLAQAASQVRGEAGQNQVAGAEVALAAAGGGLAGAAILLTKEQFS